MLTYIYGMTGTEAQKPKTFRIVAFRSQKATDKATYQKT